MLKIYIFIIAKYAKNMLNFSLLNFKILVFSQAFFLFFFYPIYQPTQQSQ